MFSPRFFGVVGGGTGVRERRWEKCYGLLRKKFKCEKKKKKQRERERRGKRRRNQEIKKKEEREKEKLQIG